jgi:hypothetical protein
MATPLRALPTSSLPSAPLARGTAVVAGKTLAIRSLTRAEALHINSLKDTPTADRDGEIYMIACGMDVPVEEAARWWDESDPSAVGQLVTAIGVVSRLLPQEVKGRPLAPRKSRSASSSKAS